MSRLLQLRVQGKEKHQVLEVSLSPVSGRDGRPGPSPFRLPTVSLWSVTSGWLPPSPKQFGFLPVLESGESPLFSFAPPRAGNLCSSLPTPA